MCGRCHGKTTGRGTWECSIKVEEKNRKRILEKDKGTFAKRPLSFFLFEQFIIAKVYKQLCIFGKRLIVPVAYGDL